jgi:hypothetical protein
VGQATPKRPAIPGTGITRPGWLDKAVLASVVGVGEVEVVEPLGLVVWVVLVEHPARLTSSATASGRRPKRPAQLCGGRALAGVVTGVSMSAHYPM